MLVLLFKRCPHQKNKKIQYLTCASSWPWDYHSSALMMHLAPPREWRPHHLTISPHRHSKHQALGTPMKQVSGIKMTNVGSYYFFLHETNFPTKLFFKNIFFKIMLVFWYLIVFADNWLNCQKWNFAINYSLCQLKNNRKS